MKYINRHLTRTGYLPLGPNVDAFEKNSGMLVGAKYVAALASGTSAIHLALDTPWMLKPGDYVIGSSLHLLGHCQPYSLPVCYTGTGGQRDGYVEYGSGIA